MSWPEFRSEMRGVLLRPRILEALWTAKGRIELHRAYIARREKYWREAADKNLIYQEAAVWHDVRRRIAARGYTCRPRRRGEVHTFAVLPAHDWNTSMLPDLAELGPVSWYDYLRDGYTWREFGLGTAHARQRRSEMNARLLAEFRRAHQSRPVDWIYVYASGLEVSARTIQRITEEFGVPTVNACFDDKQSWAGPWMGDHGSGTADLAPAFDVSWTSARVTCDWLLCIGARPVFMPEGFNAETHHPQAISVDLPVSFVGAAYGFRRSLIADLQSHNIPIRTFGHGWGKSSYLPGLNTVDIFNRSAINLGMGGIGYSETLTNLKGRDFEVPGTGGGVYLTSYNSDLAMFYRIGEEVLCYGNRQELVELARYYLSHGDEARAIADRGRRRSLAEHRWLHRYLRICVELEILPKDGD